MDNKRAIEVLEAVRAGSKGWTAIERDDAYDLAINTLGAVDDFKMLEVAEAFSALSLENQAGCLGMIAMDAVRNSPSAQQRWIAIGRELRKQWDGLGQSQRSPWLSACSMCAFIAAAFEHREAP